MKRLDELSGLFDSVKPKKIPDIVYNRLVSLITSGHFKPGERLPSERDMALKLEVSRQSIREAINRGRIEGLLEVKQGGGTFVISSLKENLKPPLSIILEEQAEKILEFLEIRKVFEGWCAEKAASTADPADLQEMAEILDRMESAKLTDAQWENEDLSFHSAIATATHNLIAMHLMEGLKDSFHSYFRVKKYSTKPERRDVLLKQHQDVYQAIKSKIPRESKKKMLKHLDFVEIIIREDFLGGR